MVQVKMRYGIDLGTTKSAICKMENGEPVIRKTDTLKDTLPSCVSYTKKKISRIGDGAYNDLREEFAKQVYGVQDPEKQLTADELELCRRRYVNMISEAQPIEIGKRK